jgi:hypothetical protein
MRVYTGKEEKAKERWLLHLLYTGESTFTRLKT